MSDTTETRTVLGLPVRGEITRSKENKVQKPLSDLQPFLQAMLDDDTVASFGWEQYTPFFNDGETCVFTVYGAWVRLVEDDPESQYDEPQLINYHPGLGEIPKTWDREAKKYVYGEYTGPDLGRYYRCSAFSRELESGHYDAALLAAFGDHARVSVSRSGIDIEHYPDHD